MSVCPDGFEVLLGNGITVVSIPTGATAKVTDNADGTFAVENLGDAGDALVSVAVDGVELTLAPGQSSTVATNDFQGFFSPVDNPAVTNVVTAGRAIPLKWRLLDADETPVTNLTRAVVRVASRPCDGTAGDELEEIAAGESGLRYLGNGNYQFNWASPKSYANSCRTLRLDLGEGITRDALFDFTR